MASPLRVLLFTLLQFSASVATATSSHNDDAFAMLQNKATASLDGQMSKEDMLSVIKSAGPGNFLQVGGKERLAAAQKMESSMENAVMKMLNSNRTYTLDDTFYDSIIAELESMLTEIVGEKTGLQTALNAANAAVSTCNTNKNATLHGSVASLKGVVDTHKNTHAICRGEEVTASTVKNASCDKLATDTSAASSVVPQCNCELSTTDASAVLTCLQANRNWYDEYESDLIAQQADCNATTTTGNSKAEECDEDQLDYEVAVCSYAEKLESMCSTLDTCYDDAMAVRESTVNATLIDENHLKAVLASAKKVACYLSILKRSSTENLTMSDFETCKQMDVNSDKTYLNSSVPDLSITYTPAVAKDSCLTMPTTPGDQSWADIEYAAFRKDWLLETVVCSHKTTTTTAAPTTTPAPTTAAPPIMYQEPIYRLDVTETAGGSDWCMDELRFYDFSGAKLVLNRNLGSAETARYSTGAYYGASQAFNEYSHIYCADQATGWLQYSFPGAAYVASYEMRIYTATTAPTAWTMQLSTDGGNTWTDVDARSGRTWTSTREERTFTIGQAPIYRLDVTETAGGSDWCMDELRFYDFSVTKLVLSKNLGSAETARYSTGAYYGASQAFNEYSHIYCADQPTGWLQYSFAGFPDAASYEMRIYTATTAPKAWKMQMSIDGGNTWTVVDTQSNQTWTTTREERTFTMG